MEDNKEMMNNEQAQTTPTPEENGGQGGKLFTQEEVNRIISDRLAREREKLAQPPKEDERETALREREKAVEARESRYKCEDYLKEINLSENTGRTSLMFLILLILINSRRLLTGWENLTL